MQEKPETALRHFFLDQGCSVVFGLAAVNDEWQAGAAGAFDMNTKARGLGRGRAVTVMIVEARLADRNHLGMPGQ